MNPAFTKKHGSSVGQSKKQADGYASHLERLLQTVRQRLWWASMVDGVTIGLLFGTAGALLFAVGRPLLFADANWAWSLVAISVGGLAGWLVGAARFRSEHLAAQLLDEQFDLKDRSITTLEFLHGTPADSAASNPAKKLQIAEAEIHLQSLDASKCVTIDAWNRPLRWAAGLAAASMLILGLTSGGVSEAEAQPSLEIAQLQASELREKMIPELEEMAKEQEDPEIEELLKELREKVDDMEKEGVDESDLMATLSEMEQAVAEAREALQMEMTDATMQALASAIKPSDELKQAAMAMESKDYEKAAEKLEAADPTKVGDKQRRAVADNLKKMVAKLGKGRNGKISESISELVEGLESKDMKECKKCMSKLASQCKKAGQCKKIGNCLSCQLNRLSECKGQCRGQCQSNIAKRSNSPSTKAGIAASGQPLGDKATKMDSTRTEQQLTGVQGEGPSETEIMQAPEGEQDAARAYAGKYEDFRRQAEAVLNSEPLPMGHRETVRKYFELIRPDNDNDSAVSE